jgi:pyridoxine 4-dehydrogenase
MLNPAGTVTAAAGTFTLGGDLEISRIGYGSLKITGAGSWGPPDDPEGALAVLRRLPELGVNYIDTADAYGPFVSEELIREALHPYDGLVVSTKGGIVRTGQVFHDKEDAVPAQAHILCRPEYLRFSCEMALRRLGVERIDLWLLHRIDPEVPREAQFGVMRELQQEGKVKHLGLSQVTVEEIEAARQFFDVVSVENRYNVHERGDEEVLRYCEEHGISFMPWYPLGSGDHTADPGALSEIAAAHETSQSQVILSWMLAHSPNIVVIPGTTSIAHLEENAAAADLVLTEEETARIDALGRVG